MAWEMLYNLYEMSRQLLAPLVCSPLSVFNTNEVADQKYLIFLL